MALWECDQCTYREERPEYEHTDLCPVCGYMRWSMVRESPDGDIDRDAGISDAAREPRRDEVRQREPAREDGKERGRDDAGTTGEDRSESLRRSGSGCMGAVLLALTLLSIVLL